MDKVVGFIGGGQMASALAAGFVGRDLLVGKRVQVFDPSEGAIERFSSLVPGCVVADSNSRLIESCDVIFVAVKPQYFQSVVQGLEVGASGRLFVSIMAGINIARLVSSFRTERVVRVMPNTPALVGHGASAFCLGPSATKEDSEFVAALLESVGISMQVSETMMDAVTGLSGSGPAFVFQFIEALADGGVRAGLHRDAALKLALQTVRGAAELAIETNEHPAVLKDRVASPGGTTIEGLRALEAGGFRAAAMDAVVAATRRSKELAEGSS